MTISPKKYDPASSAGKQKRYRDFKTYLKEKYGALVFKIPIDAGFTCPNRDGTLGLGGCIYCDGRGSRRRREERLPTITEQVQSGMAYYRENRGATLFIPYFQTFTNTYAPVSTLRSYYDEALKFPEVVGLSIGSRPDCFPEDVAGLMASYASTRDVWIEFGLQSIHDRTLKLINRCHTYQQFVDASLRADASGLLVCAHVILGLPGETPADMIATARALARLPVSGIKIHLLLVLEGTRLAEMYKQGRVRLPSRDEYASWVADFLEHLPPEVVIQRLTADGYRDILIAPEWSRNKMRTLEAIDRELQTRDSRQGRFFRQ